MRISVFAIFCLAVGIAPSFALPSERGNSRSNQNSQGAEPFHFTSPPVFVPRDSNYFENLRRVRREWRILVMAARREASKEEEVRKREARAESEAKRRKDDPEHSCFGCSSEMA
ncbi:hypothetical protein F5148DRAFT_372979 [Russula earlei]|uniref:Uncharacterized protein n=1 Tax=Russula earlei TaxID=71964 RepID=A0ACC0UHY0_9AGAM|nr:hypothetical protein F5148DRAFT_372979 [Russula earlei]